MIEQHYEVSYTFPILLRTNATESVLKQQAVNWVDSTYPNLINICTGGSIPNTEYQAYCTPELYISTDKYDVLFGMNTERKYLSYLCNWTVECTVSLSILRWSNDIFEQLPLLTGTEQINIFKKVFTPYFDKTPEDKFKLKLFANRHY